MTFYYPPRPEQKIVPSLIPGYERQGWVAQLKKNGTCNVVSVGEDGSVVFRTRHNEPNKAWTPTEDIKGFFSSFPDSIFAAELLHNKHPSVKNVMYVFDVMRYRGVDLVGTTFTARQEIIHSVKPFTPNVWLAKTYHQNLRHLFESLTDPLDEGIVLKNPKAMLQPCMRESANRDWQVKCRRTFEGWNHSRSK